MTLVDDNGNRIDVEAQRALDERAFGAEDEPEQCVWCGEQRSPFEFEDGLRCVHCAEADDLDGYDRARDERLEAELERRES